MNKNSSTAFNTDRSIFKSSLEKAKTALGSDIFLLILARHNSRDFDLYGEHQQSHDARRDLYFGLMALPDDSWVMTCHDGNIRSHELGTNDKFAARLMELLGASTVIIAPFLIEEQGFGFGCWLWKEHRPIQNQDLMKTALMGDMLSLSVRAYQNKKRARERGDKLAALLELSTVIYSSRNYTEVLQKAVRLAMQIMAADGGAVFLIDKVEMLLKPLVIIDERYREELGSVKLKIGEGITGIVAESGKGLISNHSENDPRSAQVPGTPVEHVSLISAPLTWSGDVIGAITLWSYSGREFAREDLEILTIFARQTADSIENARLFESLERAYDELSRTQEQLIMTEKLKALGDMAGGVAHDFNNVLGTILGRTQLLLMKIHDPESRRELEIIEEMTLKGRRTVQRLQDFTHVSNRLQYTQVDLNKAVEEAIETTKPAWKDIAQKVGITINLHQSLGPIGMIDGSHDELKEAVSNIILNSVDALPQGGSIWIKTFAEGDRIVLEIRDDGIGMDENTKNKLFFPFFTTKGKKGVGMGLAVVYGILFRHQADINVDSTPGKGAVFTFKFNPSQFKSADQTARLKVMEPKSLTILLVDDDINLLNVVSDMLDFLGFCCVKAEGGRVGLIQLRERHFDLVITDLGMPEIGGWDIARFCRENCPGMPVILISGWGAQLNNEDALSRVDAVLPKPFQIDELKETIEIVMAKAGGESAAEIPNIKLTGEYR
jgi:signal transduction histidine kinase/CheY-like chemotaxis protein